jgi:hypothetical protein
VCELLAASLEVVSVLGLNGILNGAGHRVVGAQDGTLSKLDFTGSIALETTAGTSTRLLALPPGLG